MDFKYGKYCVVNLLFIYFFLERNVKDKCKIINELEYVRINYIPGLFLLISLSFDCDFSQR